MKKSILSCLFPFSAMILASCNVLPAGESSQNSTLSPNSSANPSSSLPEYREGFVKAEGSELVDGAGEKILLRGTNLGGYLVHERWMCLTDSPDLLMTINTLTERFDRDSAFELLDIYQDYFWTDEDFDNVQALGLNCLRLPLSYADVFDCDFDLMRSDDPDPHEVLNMSLIVRENHLKKIDRLINEAARRGIYIILDLHGAFGSQNGNDHSIDSRQHDWLWRQDALGAAFRELTTDLWRVLAERYRDNKNVAAYDILNEPAGDANDPECVTSTTGRIQWDYFDVLYDTIREKDPNHLLIMESCWTAANLPNPGTYGWENVMYEFHHYDSNTSDEGQFLSHKNRIDEIVGTAFGVPLYMGEFCPHCSYEGWVPILDYLNKNHVSWTNWTYRVRGFSEWGLYHVRTNNQDDPTLPVSEIPAITRGNDSFEEIERKWGRDQRKGYLRNDELCAIIQEAAQAPIDFE